jgi:hypothetical protein
MLSPFDAVQLQVKCLCFAPGSLAIDESLATSASSFVERNITIDSNGSQASTIRRPQDRHRRRCSTSPVLALR